MKRLILIILIIVVVAGLIVGGLILRGRGDATPEPATNGTPSPGQLPGTIPGLSSNGGTGGVGEGGGLLPSETNIISSEPIYAYFAYAKDHWAGIQADGKVVEVQNGQLDVLSSTEIDGLIEASFSFDGKKILAIFGDRENPAVSVFNIESEAWEPISASFKAADWSPSDYKITYVLAKGGKSAIMTLDLGTLKATPRELVAVSVRDVSLDWISPSQILIAERPTAQVLSNILSLDINSKKLSVFSTPAAGQVFTWSSKGDTGLFFKSSGVRGGSLEILNSKGEKVESLNFLTLSSKCVFSEELTEDANKKMVVTDTFLNCAVPRDSQAFSNSVLPDDYFKKALKTLDSFFRISLKDGSVTTISADQSKTFDARDVQVVGDNLFFINELDQKLYAISF